MNILHYNAVNGWRGGEQQGLYLVRGLAKYPVKQYCLGQPGSEFLERTAPYAEKTFSIRSRGELNPYVVFSLLGLIRKYGIDIVHAHTTHAHAYALQARLLYGGFRLVVHRRVDFSVKDNFLSLYKYRSAKIDRIIAVSGFIKKLLMNQGVSASKIDVIYSGVDSERLRTSATDVGRLLKREYGLDEDVSVLGNISAFSGHKDHLTLIRAFDICIRKGYKCVLFLLGDGDMRDEIIAEIERRNLDKKIIMPGFRSDLWNFIGGFDVYVHSSKDEGLGTSIIDALANGIPVVSTDAGGIPEILGNNEYGLLVQKGNPDELAKGIIAMLEDGVLRKKYEKAGMVRAESFTADATVENTFKLYSDLICNK